MIFAIILFAVFPSTASAYLDPGTMSMIVNAMVGVLVGVAYTIRIFWSNLKSIFKSILSGFKKDEETQEGNN